MAFVNYTHQVQNTIPNRNPGAILLWGTAGFLYALIMVYWPILQGVIPPGFGLLRVFDVYAFLLLASVVIRALFLGRFDFRATPILWGLSLIVITRFFSVLFSPYFSPDLFWSVFRYVEFLALTWVFIALRDTAFEITLILVLVALTFIETTVGIFQVILSEGALAGTGFASERGIYELQILLVLWGFAGLSTGEGSRVKNVLKIAMGVVGVVITVLRTAFIQLLIAVLVTYWLMPKHNRRIYRRIIILVGIIAIILVVSLVSIGGFQWHLLTARMQQISEMSGTIGVRLVLWDVAFTAFQSHPLMGIGSGAFGRYQDFYFGITGVWFKEGYTDVGLSVHNTVLGFLTETGMIGLAAYFIYAIGTFTISQRLRSANPTAFNIALAGTVVSGLIIDFIAGSSFHPITLTIVAIMTSRYVRQKDVIIYRGGARYEK